MSYNKKHLILITITICAFFFFISAQINSEAQTLNAEVKTLRNQNQTLTARVIFFTDSCYVVRKSEAQKNKQLKNIFDAK